MAIMHHMRKKERKIKAKVSSNAKFSKKLQRSDDNSKNTAGPKRGGKRGGKGDQFRPSWAVDGDPNVQNGSDVDVEDIMDMVDHEDGDDLISGYLNSIEKQYEAKGARNDDSGAGEALPQEDSDVEPDDEEEEEKVGGSQGEKAEAEQNVYSDLAGHSYLENLAMVKKLKAKLQEEVAVASDAIMSHPEANINRLNKLFALLDTSVTDPEYGVIFFNVQQTVTESLCVIFNDIIPNYRLAERFNTKDLNDTSGSKKQHLKKDTMRTYVYEKSLLQYYRLYVSRLQRMLGAQLDTASAGKSNFYKVMLTTEKARRKLACVACCCLSELLSHHYNFNCRAEVIAQLTKVLCNTSRADDFMRDISAKAFGRLFKEDTLGEASIEAIDAISECVVKQSYRVSPLVFKTFLTLNLRELADDPEGNHRGGPPQKGAQSGPKKDRNAMSRKERKRNKHFSKLEKEMLEVEAVESKEKRYSHKSEIHKKIYALYFRFVKRCLDINLLATDTEARDFEVWYRPLFPPLFQGMALYSVYLNDVYIYELIKSLLLLIEGHKAKTPGGFHPSNCRLSSAERLCCLKTISQILTLSGNLLTIDFQVPYIILYELCSDPTVIYESMQLLLECIEEMVIKRFKQLSFKRITSFIQRLILLSLYLNGPEALAFLTVIKRLFAQHQGAAESLFDTEDSEQYLGMDRLSELSYNPDLQATREANASLIFHHLVHQHADPYVRYLAYAIVTHYSDPTGRTENIADNRALAKKVKDLSLMPDLCHSLVRAHNPVHVFNLMNVSSVDLGQVFHKSPKVTVANTKSKRK